MKRGRSILIAAALLSAALFAGCGKERSLRVAFVGDMESGEYQAVCTEVWQGISAYADSTNAEAAAYRPESTTVAGARNMMTEAIEDGADVIVCVGDRMGNAVYDLQQNENHTRFIVLDGVPTDGTGSNRERIRGNTYSVLFNQEEAGFLAGYAAVMDGYTNIGFLGGSLNQDDTQYGSGFIQGAEEAGKSLGLSSGAVTIQYGFMTSNAISPSEVKSLDEWFSDGCELLCVCGVGPEFIGPESAARNGGKVITSDMGHEDRSEIIAASGINYSNVAQQSLQLMEDGELQGGKRNVFGIAENGVYMKMSEGGFRTFNENSYEEIISRLRQGRIEVSGEDVAEDPAEAGITICTIKKR